MGSYLRALLFLCLSLKETLLFPQYAASGIFPSARVLTGQEEQDYWEVLKKQQHEKFSSKRKVRGRDRLVKKAQQFVDSRDANVGATLHVPGKHIRFDE